MAREVREGQLARLVLWDRKRSAIDDLDSRVTDLEDSVSTLQSDLDDLQNEAGGSSIESDV